MRFLLLEIYRVVNFQAHLSEKRNRNRWHLSKDESFPPTNNFCCVTTEGLISSNKAAPQRLAVRDEETAVRWRQMRVLKFKK